MVEQIGVLLKDAWSVDAITDDTYRTKFTYLPQIIGEWVAEHGGLSGKDILDFGCGEATTAIGVALRHPTSRVVGVDIVSDIERCGPLAQQQLRLAELPDNLSLYRIAPGEISVGLSSFDVIYSWSVFEHIDQRLLPAILRQLRNLLKPGGVIFIQIAPLYFSAEGAHLMQWIPERWGHLTNQDSVYRGKLRAACGDDGTFDGLWSMYSTLNRITAMQLLTTLRENEFTIIREYTTSEDFEIPEPLKEIYVESVLRTNQIVVLAKPAK